MFEGDVRDGRTDVSSLPVGVDHERVVRPVEYLHLAVRAAVVFDQTVGEVVGRLVGPLERLECLGGPAGVIDPPEAVRADVTRQRPNRRPRIVGEYVGDRIRPRLVLEGEHELSHTWREGLVDQMVSS